MEIKLSKEEIGDVLGEYIKGKLLVGEVDVKAELNYLYGTATITITPKEKIISQEPVDYEAYDD